ncbi:metallophosphoesterase family protein [candidate division KSB1 bacterium]|nr:metallophosphoesterase family protein [candidate division KSB1 bacterium]
MESEDIKKIGVISDTHGYLNNKVFEIFSEVDMIIHAGDIGNPDVLVALQSLAPIQAVYGNTDGFELRKDLKFLLQFEVLGFTFIVTHMPVKLEQVKTTGGVIKIFGHTHFAEIKMEQDCLIINPGSAGRPRQKGKYSVAILQLARNKAPKAEIIYFK